MITINDLKSLYGNGDEDHISTYMNMTFKAADRTEHNYNVEFYRVFGSKGKTKGWVLRVYVCLHASNSNDILIFKDQFKVLRVAKLEAVKVVNDVDGSKAHLLIIDHLKKSRQPIFKIQGGSPVIIGSHFGDAGAENYSYCNHPENSYFLYDTPEIRYGETVYCRCTSSYEDCPDYLMQVTVRGGSRMSGGISHGCFSELTTLSMKEFLVKLDDAWKIHLSKSEV